MGLLWREPLPTPASAQLPVLGKRLWLLQSRGGHAGHRRTEPACSQELTSLGASVPVLGKRAWGSRPRSLRSLLLFSAFPPQHGGAGEGEMGGVLVPDPQGDER